MRILITNNTLAVPAGTELVVLELALALRDRGHEVAAYSSELGQVASLIREAQIPVIRDLRACPFQPDLIHGQHHLDTMTALLSFPETPAIYHCHGGVPWVERPPVHPRILHYVAMSAALSERIEIELGLPPQRIHTVPNWVDLDRFSPVRTPPERPRRALVYHRSLGDGFFLEQIRAAFANRGITLDTLQHGELRQPESLLPDYDIVLAAGRSALEAIACGCAAMVISHQSCLGFVTAENFEDLRERNLSPWRFSPQLTTALLEQQLREYDAAKVAAMTKKLRQTIGLGQSVDQLLQIYQLTLDDWQHLPRPEHHQEIEAAANYLRHLVPGLKSIDKIRHDLTKLTTKVTDLKLSKSEFQQRCKRLERNKNLQEELRHSFLGRIALHFAKSRLSKRSLQADNHSGD